jgi:hypothetical protein
MKEIKLPNISLKTVIAIVLLYTLLMQLNNAKQGFIAGWNSVSSTK